MAAVGVGRHIASAAERGRLVRRSRRRAGEFQRLVRREGRQHFERVELHVPFDPRIGVENANAKVVGRDSRKVDGHGAGGH